MWWVEVDLWLPKVLCVFLLPIKIDMENTICFIKHNYILHLLDNNDKPGFERSSTHS